MSTLRIADAVGLVLGGRYRLTRPLGTGASAHVYVAEDVRLRRRVAVKLLHPGLADDAAFLRRFREEARIIATLEHPSILRVYDSGEDGGAPYLVSELLEGGSLRSLLDTGRLLTPAQATTVGLAAAQALQHARSRGLVHRDIKPANLLFDREGRLRVADFGLARALAEASWTEPVGAVMGTARYAAPEQFDGRPMDSRGDVYSLAVVLTEATTGVVPFAADTTFATLEARRQQPLRVPAAAGPLVPILEAAGTVEPEDRLDPTRLVRALEQLARALPPPGPLPLAGPLVTGAPVEQDPNPTQLASSSIPRAGAGGPASERLADRTTLLPLIEQPPAVPVYPSGPYDDRRADAGDTQAWAVAGDEADDGRPGDGEPGAELFDWTGDDGWAGEGTDELQQLDGPYDPDQAYDSDEAYEPEEWPADGPLAGETLLAQPAVAAWADTEDGTIPGPEASEGGLYEPYGAYEEAPARRRRWLVWVAAAVALFVASGAGTVAWIDTHQPPPLSAVPSLRGDTEAKARQLLEHDHLVLTVKGHAWDAAAAAGTVMAQTPPVGKRLHHNTTVAVTISRGPKPVKVPRLVGYTRYRAHKLLAAAHLRIGRITRTSSLTVPPFDIIRATPSSGTLLPGKPVAIVISTGKPKVTVPLLSGNAAKSYQAAASALRAAHLKPSETEGYSDTVPAGQVVSTSPGAHAVVVYGSHVTVHISKGPELATVPDVTGDSVTQASQTLNYYGFSVAAVNGSPSEPVARTDPAVGQTVLFGSSVQIYTRTPPPPPPTTTPHPTAPKHHKKSSGGGKGKKKKH